MHPRVHLGARRKSGEIVAVGLVSTDILNALSGRALGLSPPNDYQRSSYRIAVDSGTAGVSSAPHRENLDVGHHRLIPAGAGSGIRWSVSGETMIRPARIYPAPSKFSDERFASKCCSNAYRRTEP